MTSIYCVIARLLLCNKNRSLHEYVTIVRTHREECVVTVTLGLVISSDIYECDDIV